VGEALASREAVAIADREPHQEGHDDQEGVYDHHRQHQRLGHNRISLGRIEGYYWPSAARRFSTALIHS
jgi:hypothetical protein